MADIDSILRRHGLVGERLLDVACGTGRSLTPMLRRGYTASGCDRSPAMVRRARAKLGPNLDLRVADMRALPWRSQFDAATCVDDSINYLLSLADVVAAMRSIGEALVPGGLVGFDVNALGSYRGGFADEVTFEVDGTTFRWRGESTPSTAPGELVSAVTEALGPDGSPLVSARHVQRHYSIDQLRLACGEAGPRGADGWGRGPRPGPGAGPPQGLS